MLFVSGFSLDPALLPALPRWPGLLSPHNTGTGLIILAGVTHFYAAATRTPQLFANLNANAKRLKICVSLNLIGPGNYQIKFSCASEQLSDFVSVCVCCSHCLSGSTKRTSRFISFPPSTWRNPLFQYTDVVTNVVTGQHVTTLAHRYPHWEDQPALIWLLCWLIHCVSVTCHHQCTAVWVVSGLLFFPRPARSPPPPLTSQHSSGWSSNQQPSTLSTRTQRSTGEFIQYRDVHHFIDVLHSRIQRKKKIECYVDAPPFCAYLPSPHT